MNPPKSPIDFDYNLWITEDGKCMVRIKSTGEVVEVDRKILRVLRAEERELWSAEKGGAVSMRTDAEKTAGTVSAFSLDYVHYEDGEDITPAWLKDPVSVEEMVYTGMMEQELLAQLTPRQKDVYQKCLLGGQALRAYARENNINVRAAADAKASIKKKFKKIWKRYSTKD